MLSFGIHAGSVYIPFGSGYPCAFHCRGAVPGNALRRRRTATAPGGSLDLDGTGGGSSSGIGNP